MVELDFFYNFFCQTVTLYLWSNKNVFTSLLAGSPCPLTPSEPLYPTDIPHHPSMHGECYNNNNKVDWRNYATHNISQNNRYTNNRLISLYFIFSDWLHNLNNASTPKHLFTLSVDYLNIYYSNDILMEYSVHLYVYTDV